MYSFHQENEKKTVQPEEVAKLSAHREDSWDSITWCLLYTRSCKSRMNIIGSPNVRILTQRDSFMFALLRLNMRSAL